MHATGPAGPRAGRTGCASPASPRTSSRTSTAGIRRQAQSKAPGSERVGEAAACVSRGSSDRWTRLPYSARALRGPGPLTFRSTYGPRGRIDSYSQRAMVGPGRQERSWIRGAQAGSASDLEALFREHWPRAHRAAYLVVQDAAAAEDIAQEAFLAAIRALDRFDRRRPFGPWLHRIVVNRAIDWSRARALRAEVGGDALEERASSSPVDAAYSEPTAAALAALSPEHRAVIVLRHLLEYTPG